MIYKKITRKRARTLILSRIQVVTNNTKGVKFHPTNNIFRSDGPYDNEEFFLDHMDREKWSCYVNVKYSTKLYKLFYEQILVEQI